jgi:hypothetical protein
MWATCSRKHFILRDWGVSDDCCTLGDDCEALVWLVPELDRRISMTEEMVIAIEKFEAMLEIRYLVILLQSCQDGGAICHNSTRNVLNQIINAISFERIKARAIEVISTDCYRELWHVED